MTLAETLSLLASIVGLVIAAVSLVRTRRLEDVTARLSEKQLELIEAQEKASSRASIDMNFVQGNGFACRLKITNTGGADARNVQFNRIANLFLEGEYETKIPIKTLRPGKSVELTAIPEDEHGTSCTFQVQWENPDGSSGRDEITVHW